MEERFNLEFFKNSLYEAVNASKSTIVSISRPVYLSTCAAYNIQGWTREQIMNYKSGWAQLKRDALGSNVTDSIRYSKQNNTNSQNNMSNPIVIEERKEENVVPLVDKYAEFVRKNQYAPTFGMFKGFLNRKISKNEFISLYDLDNEYREKYSEEAQLNLFDKKRWTEEYKQELFDEIKKHNKFIFVSVGSWGNVDFNFLKSLKQYADINNALIIGIPLFKKCNKSVSDFCVNPNIQKYMYVTFEDIKLNDNLMVQVLKANCTTKSTLTGLNQLVSKYDSSIIVGGINQQLKYIPVLKERTPNLIASTGCCTDYELISKDRGVIIPTKAEKLAQDRLSIKGGLVVELGPNETFTCRNIEADENGSFIDLAVQYNANSTPNDIMNSVYVIGDLHAPQHNNVLLDANIRAIEEYHCNKVVLHDSVNMAYVSHHNAEKAITRAQMVEAGKADVLGEVEVLSDILQDLANIESVEEIIIPYSNHPSHLEGFIQDIGRMAKDDINLRTSLQVALAMLDNKNVLKFLVEDIIGCKIDKVDWVNEDSGREVYGVQIGLHGSEKVNGGRLTPTSTNNAFKKTVLAHRHSAGIDGDTVTVGIACEKEQGYNHGLSSWTESSAIVYPNGKIQLLTFVNVKGDYKLWL